MKSSKIWDIIFFYCYIGIFSIVSALICGEMVRKIDKKKSLII